MSSIESTVGELVSQLQNGEVSSVELTTGYLDAIEQRDAKVGAFLHVDRDAAIAQAEIIDAKRSQGKPVGRLAGLPVALKDVLCTSGVPTTCGSRMLEQFRPPYDAHVVEQLNAADAVLLGKTNMDEFAMGSSTENSALKSTSNPWDLERTPGGSSGGSAAAVAAGMAPLSLGTDTGGSIRQPAAFCGVVGMKPTYGRVSRYGLVAFASSLDQIGPLSRDVYGAALLLETIAGRDARDSTSVDRPVPAYTESVEKPLENLRIGIVPEHFTEGLDGEVESAVRTAIDLYKSLGAEVREVSLPHSKYAVATYYLVAPSEASSNLARYDGVHYGRRAESFENMIDMYAVSRGEGFGDEVKRRIMLGTYALSAGYYDAYYLKALKVRRLIRQDFDRAFESVDVIAGPVTPTPAFKIGELVDDPLAMYLADIYTISGNLAGLPGISIPGGISSGDLPIGLQLLAPPFEEDRLLRTARIDGMTVETASPKVEQHRKMLTRMLLTEHLTPCEREQTTGDCELEELGRRYSLLEETANSQSTRATDVSSPVIAVDHSACILCDRCIRACDDLQSNHVIGRTGKGRNTTIGFDLNDPMGKSSCVACGECVASCPTGALTNKSITLPVVSRDELTPVDTVCPYCGVGCAITYHAQDNHVVFADGRDSPVNHGRLCVKGRYGWDYASHPQRLTTPLIRRDEFYPKGPLSPEVLSSISGKKNGRKPGGIVDYDDVLPAFREASWDEALDLVGQRLRNIKEQHGSNALAGFGSAKCSNEEAYLFQKLIRAGFGTNNVDHCTRLCHASSVAALMETIGSGAVTNVFADVANSDVALITGSNTTANHPVAATFIKEAAKRGTQLILVDVRRHELADFATHFAQIRPGSDVAFYNGVMHVLIRDGLIDREFVGGRTEGFDALRDMVLNEYPPEKAAAVCGVDAAQIEAIAHTIGGKAENARAVSGRGPSSLPAMLVFWGMGISQHTHGTDNARCLISLCLLTGNVGKPGTGLHPLRGQNNVQGASDAGLIPMVYPDYQSVADAEIRQKFEQAWGVPLDDQPGLTVVEIMHGALKGDVRGMYIMGENPFISDPNSNKVRQALGQLEFLAVQDIFLTETAEFADVILPASSFFEKTGTYTNTDRRVQLGRAVLEAPGEARQDWEVVCEIGKRIGLPMEYDSPADVFDEFAALTKNYHGLSHANLGPTGKLWPCANPETEDGVRILFDDAFPTANGRGRFVPCAFQPAHELPDDEFPFVLNTGRVLEHWHTGGMTRRSLALSAIKPDAFAKMHPDDLAAIGTTDGERVLSSSRFIFGKPPRMC
eukprot:g32992.t1